MSTLKVDKLDPQTGTALEIGSNNDVITVPSGAQLTIASGATIDVSGCTLTPPATMPASSGVNLTALNATQLTSGTVPDDRFPATLPAKSGANLTALNATNLGSGAVPATRMPVGGIVQVVHASGNVATHESSDSTTPVASTVFNGNITPNSSDNSILIFATGGRVHNQPSSQGAFELRRNAVADSITDRENWFGVIANYHCWHQVWVDSPDTTSSVNYRIYYRRADGSASFYFAHDDGYYSFILMEVVGAP